MYMYVHIYMYMHVCTGSLHCDSLSVSRYPYIHVDYE